MNIYTAKNLSKFENIKHGFFDRTDGYSVGTFSSLNVGLNRGDEHVFKNREKISKHFGVEPTNLITLNQVHSTTIHIVTEDNISNFRNKQIDGDGLVTNMPGVLIGVYTADCIPLLMYDSCTRYIAAIHCGWRGAFKGMLTEALASMRNLGCKTLTVASGAFIHKTVLGKNDVPSEYQCFFDNNNVFYFQKFLYETMKNVDFEDLNINTFKNDNFFSYRRFTNENSSKTANLIRRNGVQTKFGHRNGVQTKFGHRNGVQFSGIMIKSV